MVKTFESLELLLVKKRIEISRSCAEVFCTVRSSCCRSCTEGFFLFFKFWTRCLAIKIVLKVLKEALCFVNL